MRKVGCIRVEFHDKGIATSATTNTAAMKDITTSASFSLDMRLTPLFHTRIDKFTKCID